MFLDLFSFYAWNGMSLYSSKTGDVWQILLKSIFGLAIYFIQTPFADCKNLFHLWLALTIGRSNFCSLSHSRQLGLISTYRRILVLVCLAFKTTSISSQLKLQSLPFEDLSLLVSDGLIPQKRFKTSSGKHSACYSWQSFNIWLHSSTF